MEREIYSICTVPVLLSPSREAADMELALCLLSVNLAICTDLGTEIITIDTYKQLSQFEMVN
jgi:hypothetical protein